MKFVYSLLEGPCHMDDVLETCDISWHVYYLCENSKGTERSHASLVWGP